VTRDLLAVETFRQEERTAELSAVVKAREENPRRKLAGRDGEIMPEWACTPSRCPDCPFNGGRAYPSRQDFPSARYARS